MAKTKKKLWCVSFKHDEMESELIFHIHANTRQKAISRGIEEIYNTLIFYQEDREQLDWDIQNDIIEAFAFEVTESEILK